MAIAGEDIALQLWKEQRKNLAYVLVPLLHYPHNEAVLFLVRRANMFNTTKYIGHCIEPG
jgi:hypothetical protein